MGPAAVSGVSKVLPPAAKPKQRKAKKPEAKKPEGQVSASTKEPEQKTPLAGTSRTAAQDQPKQHKAKKPKAKKPEGQVSASNKEPEQKTSMAGTSWSSAQDQDIQDLDQPGNSLASMDYTLGSLVWAKVSPALPWWPAIIDSDPDNMELGHCMTDTDGHRQAMSRYHVAFFDRPGSCVTRAWIRTQDLKPYNKDTILQASLASGDPRQKAVHLAEAALSMDLHQRRQELTFPAKFQATFDSSEQEADDAASLDIMRYHHSYILDADKTLESMKLPKGEDPVQEPEPKRARTESPRRSNRPGNGKDIGGKNFKAMTDEQIIAEMILGIEEEE